VKRRRRKVYYCNLYKFTVECSFCFFSFLLSHVSVAVVVLVLVGGVGFGVLVIVVVCVTYELIESVSASWEPISEQNSGNIN